MNGRPIHRLPMTDWVETRSGVASHYAESKRTLNPDRLAQKAAS